MSERTALLLVYAAELLSAIVFILGLAALGAAGSMVALGVLVPLGLGSYGVSWVTMHYGSSHRDHHN